MHTLPEQVPVLDVLGVKQMLLSLEKKTNKNQELRMKYPDDPSKWVTMTSRYRFSQSTLKTAYKTAVALFTRAALPSDSSSPKWTWMRS
jgi:hypothetical protein